MAINPKIQANDGGRQMVDTFGGLNRAMKIREGEWQETMNLSSDEYPLLATRQPATMTAGTVDGDVIDMIDNDGLYVLYVKNNEYYLTGGALRLNPLDLGHYGEIETPTGLVSMAAYIIVLGAKVWYNSADGTHGSIDAGTAAPTQDITASGMTHPYVMKLCPCDSDGNELRIAALTSEENAAKIESGELPGMVADGECYAVGSTRLIRKHVQGDAEEWQTQEHYLRIDAAGIGDGIEIGDYVTLSGVNTKWEAGNGVYVQDMAYEEMDPTHQPYCNAVDKYDDDPNGTWEVAAADADHIVLKGVFFTRRVTLSETAAASTDTGRKMPDMDFVVEAQNRLWGCKYGVVDGELINEIYASALGDFKNWRRYDGTSMASWAASVGTDGRWTGAISYNGSPMFFKENKLHKVSPSAYGAHQVRDYTLDGVADVCSRSLCEVDGRLYWVGLFGIYAYDGSLPAAKISAALGHKFVEHLLGASAGGADKHVYFYLEHDSGEVGMAGCYVYDVTRQTWNIVHSIRFDSLTPAINPVLFCPSHNCVYAVSQSDGNIIDLFGNEGTQDFEKPIEWSCTSGLIGYADAEQKSVTRFDLRLYLADGASMKVYVEYDSSGTFEQQAELHGTGTGSVVIPVRPRRCDHFRIRMSGVGQMALYSFQKIYKKGSDVV